MLFFRSKCGSGFCASASASTSAKVWPLPANSFSASAGLKVAENMVWRWVGKCRMSCRHNGVLRVRREAHAGLRSVSGDALPREIHGLRCGDGDRSNRPRIGKRFLQRTGAGEGFSGPGNSAGPPLISTTILPFSDAFGSSGESKSSYLASADGGRTR